MGNQICLLKNEASQDIRVQMWSKSYKADGGGLDYPGLEDDIVVKPGHYFTFDSTKVDDEWLRQRRVCQTGFYFLVYVGKNTAHSGTLEVAELVMNGGIVLSTATKNDELRKRLVPIGLFQKRFLPSWRIKAIKAETNSILDLYDEMVNSISLVNNQTTQNIRMKLWRENDIHEARWDKILSGLKEEIILEPGKFYCFDATELFNLFLKKRQSYQVEFSYRVEYLGGNSVHFGTLEVSELLNNGAIIFCDTINNDEIQKRFVSRAELQKRYLPCVRTKQQLFTEMEEEINSIFGRNVAPTVTASTEPSEVGHSQGSLPSTAGTMDDGVTQGEGDSLL